MSGRKLRWLGLGLVSGAGAGLLALTSMMNSAFAYGETADATDPADPTTIPLIMGGSGTPIPGLVDGYLGAANGLYIDNPGHPNFPDTTFPLPPSSPYGIGLVTPEGLYPLTGVRTLVFNYPPNPDSTPIAGFPSNATSVGQGITILDNAIHSNINQIPEPDISTVFGYSQSATIASYEMQNLTVDDVPAKDVQFLLIGDPSAPNGGLLERFAGFETLSGQTTSLPLNLPSLGLSFDNFTPDDAYTTVIYSAEYDGFTDFPRYPLNLLADLNAFLGIQEIHGTYLNSQLIPPTSGPSAELIASLTPLATDPADGTDTTYYMIPETPPLVNLLAGIPVIGKPLADLLGPDLTFLINLGYGDGSLGYSLPANVPTPFGLFPDVSLSTVLQGLASGAQQGVTNFIDDLTGSGTNPLSLASLDSLLPALSDPSAAVSTAAADPPSFTDIVNAISAAASTAYSVLLPTADIVNALLTSIPAWNAAIFTDNLSTGDFLDAVGLPIAADTALVTLAAGFELEVITSAISQISHDFSGLF